MNWYEQDIQKLEKKSHALEYKAKMIFYRSSSITGWLSLYDDFAKYKPVNLGFGGSTLEACGTELLKIDGLKLSIATIAYAE